MKEKSQFPKMLAMCFVLCTLNYGSMAVVGYLMYGDGVLSQVTLNLPAARLSSKISIYTTLVSPFSKYALVVTPIATAVEERVLVLRGGAVGCSESKGGVAVSVAVRTLLVLSTVAVATALPFCGYLMALVGSLLRVGACMLLPCACYVRIFGVRCRRRRRDAAETATVAGILALGALVAATGTYSSLMQMIHELIVVYSM